MKPRATAEEAARVGIYRRDDAGDETLARINEALAGVDWQGLGAPDAPTRPVVLVVGLQRSGTTLLMQLLLEGLDVTTADNLVARFWRAPWVGVAVSASLRRQAGVATDAGFESDHGVARELLGPHEFGFFWSRFFDFSAGHALDDAALARVDAATLRSELARMEHVARTPLLFKVVPLLFQLPFVARILPTAHFVHVHRDPLEVAASTWAARVARHGTPEAWWSLLPAEHERLRALDPEDQIAMQIRLSQQALAAGLGGIPDRRQTRVGYAELCAGPRAVAERVAGDLGGAVARRDGRIPDAFPASGGPELPDGVRERLARALERAGVS